MDTLVALDDSEPSWAALEYALEHHGDGSITVVHAINPADSMYGEYAQFGLEGVIEAREERAEALLDRASERADEEDVSLASRVEVGMPAQVVIETAEAVGADHIVIGSHGRTGVTRVLLGSVAERVARRAPVPVTIVR